MKEEIEKMKADIETLKLHNQYVVSQLKVISNFLQTVVDKKKAEAKAVKPS
jgi:hypothetical protein